MSILLWIGLVSIFLGLTILAVFALFLSNVNNRLYDLGFKAGVGLFLLGIALTVVST